MRIFWYACSGTGISFAAFWIHLLFMTSAGVDAISLPDLNIRALGFLFLGALIGAASAIYDWQRYSLAVRTVAHAALTLTAFSATGVVLGWFPMSRLFRPVLLFLLIYAAIWLGLYLNAWLLARRLNRTGG
ncbi:DUF3021 domain-containing protein [Bhargavaea ullalensis]|uniref:ABC-type thiamine/hydroxymethylpyrimidine transport system permease subunit n=1 Tax=Bhargavaea ullalensis TaxID=1265685 RepID=A0ABV2GEB3_9BACL